MGNILSLEPHTLPYLLSGGPVLVGVSGGRDSVALMVSLSRLDGCLPVVCHIHHGIRKETADRDVLFTEQLARQLKLPFYVEYVNVPEMAARERLSMEEAARVARQECFRQWRDAGIGQVVALAHHRHDQAETILMNLCRGGAGLRGMSSVTEWSNGMTVVRPLLNHSRDEITRFLQDEGVEWIEDETNEQSIYTRNAVRNDVIPALCDIMKRDVTVTIERTARLAEESRLALSQAIEAMELIDPQGRLYLPKVVPMPLELKKAVIFHYMKDNGLPDVSEESVLGVLSVLPTDGPSRASLPGGWIASRKEHRLRLLPPGQ